jgi:anaerobic selenocysteine-containing dehydrogenase
MTSGERPDTPPELVRRSFCRLCYNACDLDVTVVDGRVASVRGHRDNPVYEGFTCVKGRLQPALLTDENRLLHTQRRLPDGSFAPIAVADAVQDIASRLNDIRSAHGPDSVAFYYGTMATNGVTARALIDALRRATGSRMAFTPATVDKAGKKVAEALHGRWMAPVSGYSDPDVAMLVGINPLISYQGAARGNPGRWLRSQAERGMQLIVVDPRDLVLQPRPGHDAALFAAMLRVILTEGLYDKAFVAQHTTGLETLRTTVERFDPVAVAGAADVSADDLIKAARLFGRSRRGYVSVGTGPNMSGPGTLVEYLALCLDTVCGHVAREGEVARNAPTLLPARRYRAQMSPPKPATGLEPLLTASGLSASAAGPPIAGLPAEIRAGRVRALICVGGNPASAWPDQRAVVDALSALDLLVQVDPWMSNTARLADYVIAPTMPLETAEMTQHLDLMTELSIGYGLAVSYAQYSPAIVAPPAGSEVVEEWRFLLDVGRAMGLQLEIPRPFLEAARLDMDAPPTTEALLDLLAEGSRVPLDLIRGAAGGALYPEPACHVEPAEQGWTGRAELGDSTMMAELSAFSDEQPVASAAFDLRLVPRRVQHVFNSSHHHHETAHGGMSNHAYLHPDDLARLGLAAGDEVVIQSATGSLRTEVRADDRLRKGIVSMTHCYGGLPGESPESVPGSNLGLIVGLDGLQPHTGQPVMSNVPVSVSRVAQVSEASA